jgi:hypothetical protein
MWSANTSSPPRKGNWRCYDTGAKDGGVPDDRLFHKRLGHSAKVNNLTDFEHLVWMQFILSADDFGVMRFSAVTLQADSDRLATRSTKVVQRALERVRDAGLMQTFEHQGRTYGFQPDWQDYQKVKHPRQTINPRPPEDRLSKDTIDLFRDWPGKRREKLEKDSRNISPTLDHLARARPRVTADGLRLTANADGGSSSEPDLPEPQRRVQAFVDWYGETHERVTGVGYMGTNNDYTQALKLVEKFTDQDLRDAALVWFGQSDEFATSGTRTIPKFASRASGCLQTARAVVGRSA